IGHRVTLESHVIGAPIGEPQHACRHRKHRRECCQDQHCESLPTEPTVHRGLNTNLRPVWYLKPWHLVSSITVMDSAIVQAAIAEAEAAGTPVAELSLDRIARRAGMSRSTIYRRVRSRRALDDAVREAGG